MNIAKELFSISTEAVKGNTDPHRAVELLQKLSALIGMATDEWIEAEMGYNRLYKGLTNDYEKISEARANAKATEEYKQKLLKESQIDSINRLIDSMKYLIKLKMNEYQGSRYQT
jgi:hypothetical protein